MGMLLITALIAALVSVSRDKNYIRSLEEEISIQRITIKEYESKVENNKNDVQRN